MGFLFCGFKVQRILSTSTSLKKVLRTRQSSIPRSGLRTTTYSSIRSQSYYIWVFHNRASADNLKSARGNPVRVRIPPAPLIQHMAVLH